MLNGTMVHEVFQKAAVAKDFSLGTLSKLADQALCSPQHLGLMYELLAFKLSSFRIFFVCFFALQCRYLSNKSLQSFLGNDTIKDYKYVILLLLGVI